MKRGNRWRGEGFGDFGLYLVRITLPYDYLTFNQYFVLRANLSKVLVLFLLYFTTSVLSSMRGKALSFYG